MLYKIETYNLKLEELNWSQFCEYWPLAESDEAPTSSWSINSGPCRLTEEEVYGLLTLGVKLEPVSYPGAMMVKMQDRAKWEHSIPITPESLNNASAVQIAIPDMGLLNIRTVTVVEDACTDGLQAMLDKGWRILAVCPPNAARRPDYILGSNDPNIDRER